ncbi:MAG: hypothetical protein HZB56_08400 [Deltaproteobacteria bacterium]|nr:hypothetical protein [Deltaproteobacteria bacterium]
MARLLPLAALGAALLLPAAAAPGESAAACHCYRDRTFDPERPGAADPYILATTRSSLLSAAYRVDKRTLVSTAMTGTAAEDLWVAYYAGSRTGLGAPHLLSLREERKGWPAALAGQKELDGPFAAALARGADGRALASLAVDEVLATRMGVAPAALRTLHDAGASPEERILASALAARLSVPTAPLVAQVRAGKATWGQVLRDCGLTPRELDGLVRGLVR